MNLSQRKNLKRLLIATLAATSLTWCGDVSAAKVKIEGGGYDYEERAANKKLELENGGYDAAFAGMSTNDAISNRLIINRGKFNYGVAGGVVVYYGKEAATERLVREVSGNYVEINGGEISHVSGGEFAYAQVNGDTGALNFDNFTGNAFDNVVVINGGNISSGVIGGGALHGSAVNNHISIRGGTISGDVIGGVVREPSDNSTAGGNTVSVWNSADLKDANLIGGRIIEKKKSDKSDEVDTFENKPYYAGNVLNIESTGIKANSIDGFGKVNFNNVNDYNLSDFSLHVGTATFGGTLAQSFDVTADPYSNITTGSHLKLMNASSGMTFSGGENSEKQIMNKGGFEAYDITLNSDGTELTGEVGEKNFPVNPGPIVILPNFEIHTPFDTPDFNDPEDNDSADDVKEVQEQHGFEIFFNTGGYKLKTDTGKGTWIRSSAGNYDLGFARSLETKAGKLYLAPILEHGNGKYDAYLGKGKLWGQPVYGYGNTQYTAGGIIARKVNNNGFYFEASARGGKSRSNFRSNDYAFGGTKEGDVVIKNPDLVNAHYNVDAPIFIGHIRIGQAKRLNKDNLLDIYGLCFYSRQWGTDTEVHYDHGNRSSEHLDFSAVNSYRFRLGYRLTTRTSKISRVYTGLAWQYENTGNAFTNTSGGRVSSGGAKGSSGMIELGWQIKPSKTNPWLLDINAQGWCGHQHGGSLMAKMQKSF